MEIVAFNEYTLKHLSNEVKNKLDELFEECGLDVDVGVRQYDEENAAITFSLKTASASRLLQHMLSINGFGTGETKDYKIVSHNPRSYKYPWVVLFKNENRQYKVTQERAVQMFRTV